MTYFCNYLAEVAYICNYCLIISNLTNFFLLNALLKSVIGLYLIIIILFKVS